MRLIAKRSRHTGRLTSTVALLAIVASGLGNAATGAVPSPAPVHRTVHPPLNRSRLHGRVAAPVTSAVACNERPNDTPPAGGAMGPNGASQSQTLVAVPVGGGTAADTTRRQQIAEACAHVRR